MGNERREDGLFGAEGTIKHGLLFDAQGMPSIVYRPYPLAHRQRHHLVRDRTSFTYMRPAAPVGGFFWSTVFSDFRILSLPYSALGPLLSTPANHSAPAFFHQICVNSSRLRVSFFPLFGSPCSLSSPSSPSLLSSNLLHLPPPLLLFFSLLLSPPPSLSSLPLSLSLQSDSSRGVCERVSAVCVFASLLCQLGSSSKPPCLSSPPSSRQLFASIPHRSISHSSLLLSFGCYCCPFTPGLISNSSPVATSSTASSALAAALC
jgi:hypothetical protein